VAFANTEQAEFWSQIAPMWIELQDRMEETGGLPGRLAMDRLDLRAGQRVVDLGCGAGRTTLELASRVLPGGEAVGVDISAEMLAAGRERAAQLGAGNVEFAHADVQVSDLGQARFDAAYSRFGVMFFADPVAAFANVRRALRPGAVLSFVCWQGLFDNEWMLIPAAAVSSTARVRSGSASENGPGSPGPGIGGIEPVTVATAAAGISIHSLSKRPCQQTKDSTAPGRRARRTLANAATGSAKNITPKRE